MVKGTGVFSGLKIPENCRGKYVLIVDGKIVARAKDPASLFRAPAQWDKTPVVMRVPEKDEAVAAY